MADTCASLSAQIAALQAAVNAIPKIDRNELIQSTKSALIPDMNTAIAAAIAGLASKFNPQIADALQKAKEALGIANGADASAKKTFGELIGINAEIAEAKRIATLANGTANGAESKAASALQKEASLESGLAQQVRQIEAEVKAAKDAQIAAELQLRQQQLEAQRSEAALRLEAERKAAQDAETLKLSQQTDAKIAADLAARQAELNRITQEKNTEIIRQFEAKVAATEAGVRNEVVRATGVEGTINSAVAEKAAKSDLDGIRGSISALKDSIGSRISAVEGTANKALASAGNAISKSLEAIGISKSAQTVASEALGKILGIVGQIADIFVILATIQEIIAQLKTLEVLGDRIDAVERGLEALGASVSGILGKLLGLQNRIAANTASIEDVRGIANNALGIGNAANALASRSIDVATEAKNDAAQALRQAGEAVLTTAAVLALFRGIKVLKGEPGINGRNGVDGKNGVSIPGIAGRNGVDGKNGINGKNGRDGAPGIQGIPGVTTIVQVQIPGTPGKDGAPGQNGRPGVGFPGKNGVNGKNGTNGLNGKDGKDVNPADLASLRALIIQQHAATRVNINTTTTGLFGKLQAYIAVANAALTALITAIATNTYVEKALNLLTFAATVHNSFMLSNNLEQTLATIINQCVGLIIPKGFNGQPININNIIGGLVSDLIKNMIGTANYTTITNDWAKENRIYQAGANVFNQVSNAVGLLSSGLEMVGGNVGKIGNALKIWGVVGQHAYGIMNPQPKIHGKFFDFINTANAEAQTIQMMVAIPIGLSVAADAINSSIDQLAQDINQKDPVDKNGNPMKDAQGRIIHYMPGLTVPDPVVTKTADAQSKADSTNIIAATIDDLFNAND